MLFRSLRTVDLSVSLGGASRLLTPPNVTGDACHPTTRVELATALRACPPNQTLTGGFGDARAALAAECLPLPFMGIATLPSLSDMTAAALARMGAVTPKRCDTPAVPNIDRM